MVITKHNRWQEKSEKRSGSTVKGFDAPDIVLCYDLLDVMKLIASVFRKLDFRTTKAFASFIGNNQFHLRHIRNFLEERP